MYEYKVVPAPQRAGKVKGLRTTAERFAHHFAERINAEAAGGWEFLRTETLACEERSRLGRSKTTTQTVMIFGRPLGQLRPDTGAALAAASQGSALGSAPGSAPGSAQGGWTGEDPAPRLEAEDYPELPEAEAAYADIETQDAHSLPDPAGEAADPEPPLRESWHRPESAHAPAQPLASAAGRRQEPLFRGGAILHAEGRPRAEPILRPRERPDSDEA